MRAARHTYVGVAAVLTCAAASALAQSTGGSFTGSASLGVRSVDVTGTEAKFREDVNLDDGVRLAGLQLRYVPAAGGEKLMDRLELDASDLGGDPFESIHFGMRKFGAYKLEIDRRRSEYFYDDTILPAALASVAGSTGGDLHRFDFERLRDTASLDVHLAPATQLSLGLERQTRSGGSTSTLALERDEFELDRPLDETLHALTFGIQHAWDRVTLIVAEELRDFANTSELVLPGTSSGANVADAAELSFFTLDQSYDYTSRGHVLRVLATPAAKLDVTASWQREELDLDMQGSERAAGTSFAGAPFVTQRSGAAALGRDVEIADVEIGYTFNERVRLVGDARRSTLDQQGGLVFGADFGSGGWDLATDGWEVGVEVAVSATLVLAAGWSTESRAVLYDRTLNAAAAAERSSTGRDGYFMRAQFSTSRDLEITASVENNSIDDPFALASPSSSRRYKFGARRRWDNGVSLTGNYRRTDVDNDAAGWLADTEQYDARLAYRRERLQVSAGYTRVGLERRVQQLVTAGTIQNLLAIGYETASMFRDASARWQLNRRFAIGGDVRTYDTHGSLVLTRDDVRAFADVALGTDKVLQLMYRNLDYVEDAFDAYDAAILEVSIAVRW